MMELGAIAGRRSDVRLYPTRLFSAQMFMAAATGFVLAAGAAVAEARQAQTPAQAGQQQTPAPAPTPQPPPAQPTAAPFPVGSKFAYINLQRVAAESAEGKAANARVRALAEKKQGDLEGRNKELQASQQKLQQNQNVMSVEARLQLQKDIDRLTLEIQRMTQDAEAEMQDLQQSLQLEFEKKLVPAIDKLAREKQVSFIFNTESGLIWADPALDLTPELVKQLNAGAKP